jgi:NADPH:quinone reductase-like Zn-dependent oxidoreductase
MNAMGFVGQKDQFGFEATGIIRALGPSPHQQEFNVGDRVSIFGPSLLRTTLIAKSSHCFHLPLDISLEDAATIPSVYSTVMYSLVTIGRVQHGQVCHE